VFIYILQNFCVGASGAPDFWLERPCLPSLPPLAQPQVWSSVCPSVERSLTCRYEMYWCSIVVMFRDLQTKLYFILYSSFCYASAYRLWLHLFCNTATKTMMMMKKAIPLIMSQTSIQARFDLLLYMPSRLVSSLLYINLERWKMVLFSIAAKICIKTIIQCLLKHTTKCPIKSTNTMISQLTVNWIVEKNIQLQYIIICDSRYMVI